MTLRLEAQPRATRIRQRFAFWLAREGGWCRATAALSEMEAALLRDTFADGKPSLANVSAASWAEAVRRLFASAGVPPVGELPPEPDLRLHIGGTGWHGFAFDPSASLLEVPSPLTPPAGDVMRVVLDGETAGRGTVVATRRPAEASHRSPAGFTLALDGLSTRVTRLLAARCPGPEGSENSRRAPRYSVSAPAAVDSPDEEIRYDSGDEFLHDYVTNLSHGGAFVATSQPRAIGDRVRLTLSLANGRRLAIPSTVVHRTERGIGLQFELTRDLDASLSATVAGLAGRPRKVLVVDDDALVRRILVDAFEERGFDALMAPDGEAGLRTITDELFTLDAVVTDVHMPGLSGEALVSAVRKAGGEAELVLVVVTASTEADLHSRLAVAGSDRVLSKNAGPDQVVAAVEEALARRAASSEAAANESHPAVAGCAEGGNAARAALPGTGE